MDLIEQFKNTSTTLIDKMTFIGMYQQAYEQHKTSEHIKSQMKDITAFELNINLFKIYLKDKSLTNYQRYILINYIKRLCFHMRMYHPSMSNIDLDFRRAYMDFVKHVYKVIKNTLTPEDLEYWFRIILNSCMSEKHTGLAIIHLQLLNEVLYNPNMVRNPPVRITCIKRMFCRHPGLINFPEYVKKMYPYYHTTLNWQLYVDEVIGLVQCAITYYALGSCVLYDCRMVEMLFLFLNDDDNLEQFVDILYFINKLLDNNIVDHDVGVLQPLFTPYNLLALSKLSNFFQGEQKEEVQMQVLDVFNYLLKSDDFYVPRYIIDHICTKLDVYLEYYDMIIVYNFLSLSIKYHPAIDTNLAQIRTTVESIIDNVFMDEDTTHIVEVLLNYMLDIFLCAPPPTSVTSGQPHLGFLRDLFKTIVFEYECFTVSNKSRMILTLVVKEFMKIDHAYNLGYNVILTESGYLDEMDEDENIYNRDVLRKIKYNYVCKSLTDKCKAIVLDNPQLYRNEDVDDVLEILLS